MQKGDYKDYCEQNAEIPFYLQYWWYASICHVYPKCSWDVALVKDKNDQIVGAWPYLLKGNVIQQSAMDKLYVYQGPWIPLPSKDMKLYKRRSHTQKIMTELSKQLPVVKEFNQIMHPNMDDWKALYWQGFHQQVVPSVVCDIKNDFRENNDLAISVNEGEIDSEDVVGLRFASKIDKQLEKYTRRILVKIEKDGVLLSSFYSILDGTIAYLIDFTLKDKSEKNILLSMDALCRALPNEINRLDTLCHSEFLVDDIIANHKVEPRYYITRTSGKLASVFTSSKINANE